MPSLHNLNTEGHATLWMPTLIGSKGWKMSITSVLSLQSPKTNSVLSVVFVKHFSVYKIIYKLLSKAYIQIIFYNPFVLCQFSGDLPKIESFVCLPLQIPPNSSFCEIFYCRNIPSNHPIIEWYIMRLMIHRLCYY